MVGKNQRIQASDEINCLKVFVSAVFVGDPFAVVAVVVEIEHRGHSVNTKSVNMIIAKPEFGRAHQEGSDLVPTVVKDLGAPLLMFALSRVGVFVAGLAVKVGKTVCVSREVGRNPVENDTDTVLVALIDKIHKIVRCAVP